MNANTNHVLRYENIPRKQKPKHKSTANTTELLNLLKTQTKEYSRKGSKQRSNSNITTGNYTTK